jgi:xanthine dehydrogenase accessory factor
LSVSEFERPTGAPSSAEAFEEAWDGATPYARAIVVRTKGSTAAQPGARAVITANGDLIGFVGGGCLRRAVLETSAAALKDGRPQLIRSKPKDEMDPDGVDQDVTTFASGCPSRGEVDVFIEPVLPRPPLVVFGEAEMAHHLRLLGHAVGLNAVYAAVTPTAQEDADASGAAFVSEAEMAELPGIRRGFAVVATQGQGDKPALLAALNSPCCHVFFVASRKKAAHWRERLSGEGIDPARIDAMIAPAGYEIGAATPAEIAVSILAQIIELRRKSPEEDAHG